MTSSPEHTPLKIIRLDPEEGVPNIPETLEGMQLVRKKGHVLYLLCLNDPPTDRLRVVGYFSLEERNTPRRWDWRVSYLYVLREERRQGIAAETLRVIKREFGILTASVPEDNLPAQLLLKHSGFRCTRTVGRGGKSWFVFQWPPEGPS